MSGNMLLALLVACQAFATQGSYLNEGQSLLTTLFTDYQTDLVPMENKHKPVNVEHSMSLQRIVSLKNNMMTVDTWIQTSWTDIRLKWNKNDFPEIKILTVDNRRIWKPDIYLYNNAGGSSGMIHYDTPALIQYDGKVTYIPQLRYTIPCEYKHQMFSCKFKFGSWTHSGNELNLTNTQTTVGLSDYQPHSQIEILQTFVERKESLYACCPEIYIDLSYNVSMSWKDPNTFSGR